MQVDSRNSTFARIGRSYARPSGTQDAEAGSQRPRSGYWVAGSLFALLSALGLIGWFLAR
jgi:hypothetical protein